MEVYMVVGGFGKL